MKKTLLRLALIIIALIILIQLYRPERYTTTEITSDDVTNVLNVPDNVQKIIKRSCYDCHSNHTKWPWYSAVAPVSWFVISDVSRGRSKMNFSEWGKYSITKQGIKLDNICDEISEGDMPLKQYLYLHKDAVLSKEEKDILCGWAKEQLKKLEDNGD